MTVSNMIGILIFVTSANNFKVKILIFMFGAEKFCLLQIAGIVVALGLVCCITCAKKDEKEYV